MTSLSYNYDSERLRPWMLTQLVSRGVAENVASHVVSSTIETSLRGVDSHGINLFPHYCAAVASGRINLEATIKYYRKSPSLAILDADWTLGHHVGAAAMDYAQEIAAETGFALVNVKNSSHFGAASYFALRAARSNYMAFAFTNADALVKAYNAKHYFFGTNPVCFAVPMDDEDPLCLDMATSTVAWNRIKNHRLENLPIQAGWAFDSNGNVVTNPNKAVSLAPSGSYKGFGLGLMVEVLCSVISGSVLGKDIPPMYQDISEKRDISHTFIALDISQIHDICQFKAQLTEMVHRIRMMDPLGDEDVMVPGDPEKKSHKIRSLTGIPVSSVVHDSFKNIDSAIEDIIVL